MTEVTGVTVDVAGAMRGFQRLSIGNFLILDAWELTEGACEGPLDKDPGPEGGGNGGLRPEEFLRVGEDVGGPPPPEEMFDDEDTLVARFVSTLSEIPEPNPAPEERGWIGGVGNDPDDFLACPLPLALALVDVVAVPDPAAAAAAVLEFFTASAIL